MSKVNELRTLRAKAWDKAQAFLTANRNDKGILSEEDVRTYEALEQDIVNLGHEIERQERLEAMEREMAAPVFAPITAKPEASVKKDEKTGRAADAYVKAFWAQVRAKDGVSYEVRNVLSEGVDSEGGYLVPDEFENTLISGLEEEGSIRSLAHIFTTSNAEFCVRRQPCQRDVPVLRSQPNRPLRRKAGAIAEPSSEPYVRPG